MTVTPPSSRFNLQTQVTFPSHIQRRLSGQSEPDARPERKTKRGAPVVSASPKGGSQIKSFYSGAFHSAETVLSLFWRDAVSKSTQLISKTSAIFFSTALPKTKRGNAPGGSALCLSSETRTPRLPLPSSPSLLTKDFCQSFRISHATGRAAFPATGQPQREASFPGDAVIGAGSRACAGSSTRPPRFQKEPRRKCPTRHAAWSLAGREVLLVNVITTPRTRPSCHPQMVLRLRTCALPAEDVLRAEAALEGHSVTLCRFTPNCFCF